MSTFVQRCLNPIWRVSRVRNSRELGKDTLAEADETRGRRDETDKRPRWLRGKKVLWLGVLLFFFSPPFFFFSFFEGEALLLSLYTMLLRSASLNMHREKQGRDCTYLKLKPTMIESPRENDYNRSPPIYDIQEWHKNARLDKNIWIRKISILDSSYRINDPSFSLNFHISYNTYLPFKFLFKQKLPRCNIFN